MTEEMSSLPLVVITDSNFGDDSIEREILGANAVLQLVQTTDSPEVIAAARDASALLVQYASIDREVFEHLKKLKVVVRYGIGLDNVDLEAAQKRGVLVRNVDDYCIDEVADHTVAAVRCASRRLVTFDRRIKDGAWGPQIAASPAPPSQDPVGIAGFGRIGAAVARRLAAQGHPILVWDPPAEVRAAESGYETIPSLERLAAEVNHLCLHVPATEATKSMVNDQVLEQLGPGGHVVNCARGALIDEPALLSWLAKSPDAFATLDVFVSEPPDGCSLELASHPQVLATPHVAYLSTNALPRLRRTAARHVLEGLGIQAEKAAMSGA